MAFKKLQLLLLFLAILFCNGQRLSGQTFFENKQFGIKFLRPENWILNGEDAIKNSIDNIKLTEAQIMAIVNSRKGIISLCALSKYDPANTPGIIPTIKITIRKNPAADFEEFRKIMIASTERLKTIFDDFELTEKHKKIQASKKDCLYYSCRYSFKGSDSGKTTIRTKCYDIPSHDYYISITLMDSPPAEDCTQIFDQLIKSLLLQ